MVIFLANTSDYNNNSISLEMIGKSKIFDFHVLIKSLRVPKQGTCTGFKKVVGLYF